MKSDTINWINSAKAFSMIFVYLLHSEIYYGGIQYSYGYWVTPFYVSVFFFVSGYLFFKKQMNSSNKTDVNNSLFNHIRKSTSKVFGSILWPTIVFSTLIYIPKIFYHGQTFSFTIFIYEIFGGTSYWFTSALIIAQCSLIILVAARFNNIFLYLLSSIFLFLVGLILANNDLTPFPWFYKSGLGATLFMSLGGVYLYYENKINSMLNTYIYTLVFLIYIFLMFYDNDTLHMKHSLLSMNFNILGFFTSIMGIIVIIGFSKILPSYQVFKYIGRNSITYYFLSGVLPASISYVLSNIFNLYFGYLGVLLVLIFSLLVASFISIVVNKYFPFLLDFKKIKSKIVSHSNLQNFK